jgi:hypothetical protein
MKLCEFFFVMKGYKTMGLLLPLLLYFYSLKILIKLKSKQLAQRFLLELEVQKIEKKKTKISRKYAKM